MGGRATLSDPDIKCQTALLQVCSVHVVDLVLNRACLGFTAVKAMVYKSGSFQGTTLFVYVTGAVRLALTKQ